MKAGNEPHLLGHNLFVYLFEDYKVLSKKTKELRAKMLAHGDQLLPSTLTIGEVLVKPLERGATDACEQYEKQSHFDSRGDPFRS